MGLFCSVFSVNVNLCELIQLANIDFTTFN